MIEQDGLYQNLIGKIIRFVDKSDDISFFNKFKQDYFLESTDIQNIDEYNAKNNDKIENYDILSWALKKQLAIGVTKGAKGKRYLFWNSNLQNLSETVFELIALSNYDQSTNKKIYSISMKKKETEGSSIILSSVRIGSTHRQRFYVNGKFKESIIDWLSAKISNSQSIELPIIVHSSIVSEKMPMSKSVGGRFPLEKLQTIGIIEWSGKQKIWKISNFGSTLLRAIQSWIISYSVSKEPKLTREDILVWDSLSKLQKIDLLFKFYQNNVPSKEFFQLFGTNKHLEHIHITSYCIFYNKITEITEGKIFLRDIMVDENAFYDINCIEDIWSVLRNNMLLPTITPVKIDSIIEGYRSYLNSTDVLILIPGNFGSGKSVLLGQLLQENFNNYSIKIFNDTQDFPLLSQIKNNTILAIENISELTPLKVRTISSWFDTENQGVVIATIQNEFLEEFKDKLRNGSFPSSKLIIGQNLEWGHKELEVLANHVTSEINRKFDPTIDFSEIQNPIGLIELLIPETHLLIKEKLIKLFQIIFTDLGDWKSEKHKLLFNMLFLLSEVNYLEQEMFTKLLNHLNLSEWDHLVHESNTQFIGTIVKSKKIKEIHRYFIPNFLKNFFKTFEYFIPIDSKLRQVNEQFRTSISFDAKDIFISLLGKQANQSIKELVSFLQSFGEFGMINLNKFFPDLIDGKNSINKQKIKQFDSLDLENLISVLEIIDGDLQSRFISNWYQLQTYKILKKEVSRRKLIDFIEMFNVFDLKVDEKVLLSIIKRFKRNFNLDKYHIQRFQDFINNLIKYGYNSAAQYILSNFKEFLGDQVTFGSNHLFNMTLLEIQLLIIKQELKKAKKRLLNKLKLNYTQNKRVDKLKSLYYKLNKLDPSLAPFTDFTNILNENNNINVNNLDNNTIETSNVERLKQSFSKELEFPFKFIEMNKNAQNLVDNSKWSELNDLLDSFEKEYGEFLIEYPERGSLFTIEWLRKKGTVLRQLARIEESSEYLDKALILALREDDNSEILARLYGQIASNHKLDGHYDKAIEFLRLSYNSCLQIEDLWLTAQTINGLGSMYGTVKEYENAINWLNKGINLLKDTNDENCNKQRILMLINLARVYWEQKKYKKAEKVYQDALKFDDSIPDNAYKMKFSETMSKQENQIVKEYLSNILNNRNQDFEKKSDHFKSKLEQQIINNDEFEALWDDLFHLISNLSFNIFLLSLPNILYLSELSLSYENFIERLNRLEDIIKDKIDLGENIVHAYSFAYFLGYQYLILKNYEKARFWWLINWFSVLIMDTNVIEDGIDGNVPFRKYLNRQDENTFTQSIEVLIFHLTEGFELPSDIIIDDIGITVEITRQGIFIGFIPIDALNHPLKKRTLLIFGYLAYVLKYKKESMIKYHEIIDKWPEFLLKDENGMIWSVIGRFWDHQSNWLKMCHAYEKAIEINKNPDPYWFHLGFAYSQLKKYEAALNAFDQVLKLDPDDIGAMENKIEIYLVTKDFSNALQVINKLKKRLPESYKSKSLFMFYELLCNELLDVVSLDEYLHLFEIDNKCFPAYFRYIKSVAKDQEQNDKALKNHLLELKSQIEKIVVDLDLEVKDELKLNSGFETMDFEGKLLNFYVSIIKVEVNEINNLWLNIFASEVLAIIKGFLSNVNEFKKLLMNNQNPLDYIFSFSTRQKNKKIATKIVIVDELQDALDYYYDRLPQMRDEMVNAHKDDRLLEMYQKLQTKILLYSLRIYLLKEKTITFELFVKILSSLHPQLLYEHLRFINKLDLDELPNDLKWDILKQKAPLLRDLHKVDDAINIYKQLKDNFPGKIDGWIGLRDCYLIKDDLNEAIFYNEELVKRFSHQDYIIELILLKLNKGGSENLSKILGKITEPSFIILKYILLSHNNLLQGTEVEYKRNLEIIKELLFEILNIDESKIDLTNIISDKKNNKILPSLGWVIAKLLNPNPNISIFQLFMIILYIINDDKLCKSSITSLPNDWLNTMITEIFSMEVIPDGMFYLPSLHQACVYLEMGMIDEFSENLEYAKQKWRPLISKDSSKIEIQSYLSKFSDLDDIRNVFGNFLVDLQNTKMKRGEVLRKMVEKITEISLDADLFLDYNLIIDDPEVIIKAIKDLPLSLLLNLLVTSYVSNLYLSTKTILSILIKKIFNLIN